MTYYDTKTMKCPNCGRTFIWRADEQRHFNSIGYEDRKYCDLCRAKRKDYFRSSQVDHPTYSPSPVPPSSLPMEPAEPVAPLPTPKPTGEKRPSWVQNPMVLWALVILLLLVSLLFVMQIIQYCAG